MNKSVAITDLLVQFRRTMAAKLKSSSDVNQMGASRPKPLITFMEPVDKMTTRMEISEQYGVGFEAVHSLNLFT